MRTRGEAWGAGGAGGDATMTLAVPTAAAEQLAVGCDALVVNRQERACCAELIAAANAAGATVAVTDGDRPSTILAPDGSAHELDVAPLARPPLARPLDDLGAGDVFAAAFFIALAERRSPRDAARFANAAAAVRMLGVGADAIGGSRRSRCGSGPGVRGPSSRVAASRRSRRLSRPGRPRSAARARPRRCPRRARTPRGKQQAAADRSHLDDRTRASGAHSWITRTSGSTNTGAGLERAADQAHREARPSRPGLADDRDDLLAQLAGPALVQLARNRVAALGELGGLDRERRDLALGERLGVDVRRERLDARRPEERRRGIAQRGRAARSPRGRAAPP